MHTDEYEISTGREIVLCRTVIDRLKKSMQTREDLCGLMPEAILEALERDVSAKDEPEFQAWLKEYEELRIWEKRLKDYEESLQVLKGI